MTHDLSKDLTQGSVTKNLVAFALPLLLSTLLQALYNVVDMLVVGIFTDAAGLSGVSIGGFMTVLVTNVVISLVSGGTVLISQYHGAKRFEEEGRAIGTLLGSCLAAAALVTAAGVALAGPIVRLLDSPPESFAQARDYLRICMGGSVFIFGYNAMSAVFRGLGDSKRPLVFVSIATAANVALDLLMVGVLRMGAAGAAWATVASQALSLALCVAYLVRRGFRFSIRIRADMGLRMLKVGVPAGLQQLIVQLSFMVLLVIVNGFGVSASAAAGVCSKVNGFAILPGLAMSAAISAMAGQNIGAGRYDRAFETMTAGIKVILPIGLVIFAAVNAFTARIIGLFSADPAVLALGTTYMRYLSVDALTVTTVFCLAGLLIGAGRTTVTMLNSILSSFVLRVPLALLFTRVLGMGLAGVGLAAALSPAGSLAVAIAYVASGRWKRSVIREGSPN